MPQQGLELGTCIHATVHLRGWSAAFPESRFTPPGRRFEGSSCSRPLSLPAKPSPLPVVPETSNPLLSTSPLVWNRLIEGVEPASLLLVIERRMSAGVRALHTAEDIFQEALMHAWRDRHQFEWRGVKSFRSWLLSIIDHRIHDLADRGAAAKRAGDRPTIAFSALGDGDAATTTSADPGFPAASTTPSRLAMYREQAETMRLALEGLPEELRDIVRLRLFEQFPLEEIAERMGLGVSAVRHRFRKGSEIYLRRLRAALGSRSASNALESSPKPAPQSSPTVELPLQP